MAAGAIVAESSSYNMKLWPAKLKNVYSGPVRRILPTQNLQQWLVRVGSQYMFSLPSDCFKFVLSL